MKTETDRTAGILAARLYLQDKRESKPTLTILDRPWLVPIDNLKNLTCITLPPLTVTQP